MAFFLIRLEAPLSDVDPLPLADSLNPGEAQLGYYWQPTAKDKRTRWASRWLGFWREERVVLYNPLPDPNYDPELHSEPNPMIDHPQTPGIFAAPVVNCKDQIAGLVWREHYEAPILGVVPSTKIREMLEELNKTS